MPIGPWSPNAKKWFTHQDVLIAVEQARREGAVEARNELLGGIALAKTPVTLDECIIMYRDAVRRMREAEGAIEQRDRRIAELEELLNLIGRIPAVADRAGVGDGSVHDAVVALSGALVTAEAERDALKELLRRVIHYCDNVDVTGAYTDYKEAPECDLYSSGLYEECKAILAAKFAQSQKPLPQDIAQVLSDAGDALVERGEAPTWTEEQVERVGSEADRLAAKFEARGETDVYMQEELDAADRRAEWWAKRIKVE